MPCHPRGISYAHLRRGKAASTLYSRERPQSARNMSARRRCLEELMQVTLSPTRCAICETESNATEIYPASHDPSSFSPATFSARRIPDRVHYRMVRCNNCGLVRSDPVADPALIAELYARSTFDYANEAKPLQRTYGRYLKKLGKDVTNHSLLEIGCGNGFFLEQALRQGYGDDWGVEPRRGATESAALETRPP